MSWKSLTDYELDLCLNMAKWLDIRKAWSPQEGWLPTSADIIKSALFERLRSGRQPLNFPPPTGLSCPWYAVLEDRGPHFVGDGGGFGPNFYYVKANDWECLDSHEKATNVSILQSIYKILEKNENYMVVQPENQPNSPYRFKLWYESEHENTGINKPLETSSGIALIGGKPTGGWFMQNLSFSETNEG